MTATKTTWPPNPPLSQSAPSANEPIQYRGFEIDAGTNVDGQWITTIDGDEISGYALSRPDALRRGKSRVNRKLGVERAPRTVPEVDEAYFDRLRAEIGGE